MSCNSGKVYFTSLSYVFLSLEFLIKSIHNFPHNILTFYDVKPSLLPQSTNI